MNNGCPNALLEAAAASKALVCSRTPPIQEIFHEGVECLMHVPEDAIDLSRVVRRLLADCPLRAKLGAAARARVVSAFSEGQEIATLIAMYERALAARSTRQASG